jgi:FtsP/CotA-like multicopper oxidase with cupredoxin domain
MTSEMQKFTLAIVALGLTACTTPRETEAPPAEEPPVEEPAYTMPNVWGTPVLEDVNPDENIVEVYLTAHPHQWTLSDGTVVDGMAYNGSVPGPLLQAKLGDEIIVHFQNDLAEPTTVHWHGLRIPDTMDGSPRVMDPVPPGGTFEYRFTPPEAASYWYHPHVNTNQQVEKGLAGVLVVHGEDDPLFANERYVVLDDIFLDTNGKIPPTVKSGMEAMHGRSGNQLLTNGQTAETVRGTAEQGQIERWRIVNTANARTMKITVEGAVVRVIGTDGGLLPEPYWPQDIIIPVGQRYDLEVAYDQPGEVTIQSHLLTLDSFDNVIEVPFQVFAVDVTATENMPIYPVYPELAALPTRDADESVEIRINAVQTATGEIEWQLNGPMTGEPLFRFEEGRTVNIQLKNEIGPEHPFHLHGQFFQIADAAQPGLKDTVLVPGLATVNITAYMDNPGHWMTHCHILEHAELGMMREIFVDPKAE